MAQPDRLHMADVWLWELFFCSLQPGAKPRSMSPPCSALYDHRAAEQKHGPCPSVGQHVLCAGHNVSMSWDWYDSDVKGRSPGEEGGEQGQS